jgi:hypothetical protein
MKSFLVALLLLCGAVYGAINDGTAVVPPGTTVVAAGLSTNDSPVMVSPSDWTFFNATITSTGTLGTANVTGLLTADSGIIEGALSVSNALTANTAVVEDTLSVSNSVTADTVVVQDTLSVSNALTAGSAVIEGGISVSNTLTIVTSGGSNMVFEALYIAVTNYFGVHMTGDATTNLYPVLLTGQ